MTSGRNVEEKGGAFLRSLYLSFLVSCFVGLPSSPLSFFIVELRYDVLLFSSFFGIIINNNIL